MTTELTREELEAMGIGGAGLGEPTPVPPRPISRMGVGSAAALRQPEPSRAGPTLVDDTPRGSERAVPAWPVDHPDAARLGFSLAWATNGRLVIECEEDFEVVPRRVLSEGGYHEAGRLELDPTRWTSAFACLLPDGTGLCFKPNEAHNDALVAWAVVRQPLVLPPRFEDSPEVAAWLAEFADDPWLVSQAEALLSAGSKWGAVVAAGLLRRLHRPGPQRARAAMAELLAGRDTSLPDPGLRWVRELSPAQAEALDRLAAEEAHMLGDALDDALERIDPEDESWRRVFTDLLIRRDELAGVLDLLTRGGHTVRAKAATASLDETMADEIEALPVFELTDERQLRRAAIGQPDAWWVQPLNPAEEEPS